MPLFVGASESYDTDAWEAYNLKKENAKLREEIEAAKHDLSLFSGELVASKLENAKLRELIRMMWKPFCWAQSGYDVCLTDEQDRAIRDMVRELGVDVD